MGNKKSAKDQAGFFSLLFSSWLFGLIRLANQRPLKEDDLYKLSESDKAEVIVERFEKLWNEEVDDARKKKRNPRLWKTIFRFISVKTYITLWLLRCTESWTNFISALLLWLYLRYLSQGSNSALSYITVLGIGISGIIKALALHHHNMNALLKGMRLKTAYIGMVYKKILTSTRSSLSSVTAGHTINLVSNDARRMEEFILSVFMNLTYLNDLPISIVLLVVLVGWQSLTGVAVVIIISISISFLSKKSASLRRKQASVTDKRLVTLNDIITGIRTVKMYAWELKYRDKVKTLRRKELKLLAFRNFILSLSIAVSSTLPVIATLVGILTMAYAGAHLNAVNIFTVISLINIISQSTVLLFYGTRGMYDGIVSVIRIQNFLLNDQSNIDNNEGQSKSIHNGQKNGEVNNVSKGKDDISESGKVSETRTQPYLKLCRISSCWSKELSSCNLRDVSFTADANKLVMVTGPVGSGKTTLLMTILRQIPIISGNLSTKGKIAYASQIPWIFTGTVRENVLFGKEYEEKRYQRVLQVCDLTEDIFWFPKGDLSMVGQRGVSLSGGQRARVGLARAVYSDADIFLLDDPLSAVDAKVGKHIFNKCICEELSEKIRILVTHQLQYLPRADKIVVLKGGRMTDQGTFAEINQHEDFNKMLAEKAEDATDDTGDIKSSKLSDERDQEEEGRDMVEKEEGRQVGTVSWRLYWDLFRAGVPTFLIIFLLLLYIVAQAAIISPTWWLKVMAKMSYMKQRSPITFGIYGGMVVGSLIMIIIRILCLFTVFVRSSKTLHDKMTRVILQSPVIFFDTNPAGRIMNRFSKDIGALDDLLPFKFVLSIENFFRFFGIVALTAFVNYWFVIVMIPTVAVFFYICHYYLTPARELSRFEAIRCSPVYEHVTETTKGLEIIHSLGRKDACLQKLYQQQNMHSRAFSLVILTARWVTLNIDLLCGLFVIAVGVGSSILSLDSATTGLIMTYAISLSRKSSLSIRCASEVETQMVSVERAMAYTKLPTEPGYDRQAKIPENWPNRGALSLQGVSMVYIDGGPTILKDINLDVHPREKVGIAGRTGAGKSSLVAALFRMPEPQGHVLVDGIDLGTINVQDARKSMVVITQDPIMFEGSLKKNLDPFDQFTEDEIWTALNAVQLVECVRQLDGLLEYSFGEGGSGFSAGERQLLCLARALLQRPKIIVLDEATANVDYKTDQLIQKVIREKFADCTVLTIAHRLNTIIDYDRIVVLDGGRIVEDDSPNVLVSKENGIFAKLMQDHGRN